MQLAAWLGTNPLAGLAVGVLTGHILDYVATIRLMQWRYGRMAKAQARSQFQQQFVHSLFYMLAKICGCDGAIEKTEIAEVERIMTEVLKLGRKDRAKAIAIFKSARTASASFQSMAVQYFEIYRSYPAMLESTVQMFMKLASADGKLNEQEERLIHTAATVFGIEEQRYQELKRPFFNGASGIALPNIEKCYALLGCQKSDSVTDIKKSYRKLVSEFHPDKIYSKDLPTEFIDFANQKMKDIQHAYDQVKAERGFT